MPGPRSLFSSNLTLVWLVLISVCVALIHFASGVPQLAAVAQQPQDSIAAGFSCSPSHDKRASPPVVLLGESASVTLHVSGECDPIAYPIHVVLVFDAFDRLGWSTRIPCPTCELGGCRDAAEDDRGEKMKGAAEKLIRGLRLAEHEGISVGLVQVRDDERTVFPLSTDEKALLQAVDEMGTEGQGQTDEGIADALALLQRARKLPRVRQAVEIMVVLTDAVSDTPGDACRSSKRAATAAKADGVLIATVGICCPWDDKCLVELASSPRYFFESSNAERVVGLVEQRRVERSKFSIKLLAVDDVLPENMRYVPGSGEPAPKSISPNGRALSWEANFVPPEGITLTYAVEPLEVGFHPTNLAATAHLTDNRRARASLEFPVPSLLVLRPDRLPTPYSSPTYVPATPSPVSSATTTPAPTRTPTARPRPIYLPVAVKHPCEPLSIHADVALVLDVSTSMDRTTRTGRSKLAATTEKAKQFVGWMHLTGGARSGDRVAVLGFNSRAWIEEELADRSEVVLAAIDRLGRKQAAGTRLDLAVRRGAEALSDLGAPSEGHRTQVIILLTDGIPNRVPPAADGTMATTVLAEATRVKDMGARIYTIAIGAPEDTNPELLKTVASHEAMYYYEPDPEDLAGVYSEIAHTIRCPLSRYAWDGPWPQYP